MRIFLLNVICVCLIAVNSTSLPFAYAEISVLSEDDRLLLKEIQKDTFDYFLAFTNQETGLTHDSSRTGSPASIAATGFALASFAIGSSNGWLSYREAYEKIEKTLDTL